MSTTAELFQQYLADCRLYWASKDAPDMIDASPKRLWLHTPHKAVGQPFSIGEEVRNYLGTHSAAPKGVKIFGLTETKGDERQVRRLIGWY